MNGFQYHPDIMQKFPNTIGGMLYVREIQNKPAPATLQAAFAAEQEAVKARIGETPLSELETLAAWRRSFREFGVDPTQYRNAAESLLRRLTKKGDIPSINTLVDIGNLVSIRYGLPIAVIDTRHIQGYLTVRFADGSEDFTGIDEAETSRPALGEVIFADEQNAVFARRWCWKQGALGASTEATTNALFTIEAQHEKSRDMVEKALGDVITLVMEHLDGSMISGILDKWKPQIPKAT